MSIFILKKSNFGYVSQVSCGLNHTLVVSLDGMVVWAFGDGDYGKLGTGSSTAKYYPQVGQHYQRFAFRNPGRTKSLCLCYFFSCL